MLPKLEKMEELIARQEKELNRSILVNRILYLVIVAIFVTYAIIVPNAVGKILDPEVGAEIVVLKVKESMPSPDSVIEEGKKKIPVVVGDAFNRAEELIPHLESLLAKESQNIIKTTTAHIQEDMKPMIKGFIKDHMAELKEGGDALKSAEAMNKLNEDMSKDIDVIVDKKMLEFKEDLTELTQKLNKIIESAPKTEKERARKNLLLAFARLNADEQYKDQATERFMKHFFDK